MQKLKDFPAEVEFSSPVFNPGLLNNLGLGRLIATTYLPFVERKRSSYVTTYLKTENAVSTSVGTSYLCAFSQSNRQVNSPQCLQ